MLSKSLLNLRTASLAGMALIVAVPAFAAEITPQIGILSCDVSAGVGMILERKETLNCTYTPNNGTPEAYTGTIEEFGLEIGTSNQGTLVWGVAAATQGPIAKGSLAGKYAGVTAEAAVGLGVGANVLLGGTGNSISLQPVSVEGTTGINVAAGVLKVTLNAVP